MLNISIVNSKVFFFDCCKSIFIDKSDISVNEQYVRIDCIGTPLYKNYKFIDGFQEIIADYFSGNLQQKNIKGNYLFLFQNVNSLKILSDKTFQHHLFYDRKSGLISNSFLHIVENKKNKLELNDFGFYEKLILGFNLTENTVIKDIVRISPDNLQKIKKINVSYVFDHRLPKLSKLEFHSKGKNQSLLCQQEKLCDYFKSINLIFKDKIGDLGLSGGFDCRLLLALAEKNINSKLHLHTHATAGVHERQSNYAEMLARVYGTSVDKVITISPNKLNDDQFFQMLDDNITFFDGRTARHLGAYSQTYTQNYKKQSMGNAFYSLNGLGGEIYRDSYFTGSKKMSWDEWAERYLFLEGASLIVSYEKIGEISSQIKEIIRKRLGWDKEYYDIVFTHAYYGFIKMPLCNGNLVSAYNKISPFLLPFVEYSNVLEALKAIPYLKIGGSYQARLIEKISPRLAEVNTSYGSNFKNLGLKYYFWSFLKTIANSKKRNKIVNASLIKKSNSDMAIKEFKRLNEINAFKNAISKIIEIDNRININVALVESTQKRNIIVLSHFLRKYL